MGHYSDDYEYEAEKRRERFYASCKKAQAQLRSLRECLPKETPERFENCLEDLENWLYRQKDN